MQIVAGQVAVITGGASGIGAALGRGFAARGLHVVLADVQPDRVRATAAEIGEQVLAVPTDVSDPDQVESLAQATLERFGRIDIICNNAGVVPRPAVSWEQPVQSWRWVIDVSLLGVIYGIRSFVPHLVTQDSGYVLNTASMGGLVPLPMIGPYSAVKHAIVGLTETLRAELRDAAPGVEAGVLCPGMVATELGATSAANAPGGMNGEAPPPMAGPNIMTADVLAERTFAGIESGRVHLVTHPDRFDQVRARLQSVADDLVDLGR